ncbi:uncharacterized protein LOC113387840 [Ctenocephalides felis]|uniref:uncharacterized protein LOC113387840 n=1 Tax=Ctenocephalides felis TaxID=7515 RepID=UPI000E6E528B|nr:uncharacterized protein LOC113387840 [Ctenocephalides felis]
MFYKNPTYDKAMVVSKYEILDNDNEDLDVYNKVEEIEKRFKEKTSRDSQGGSKKHDGATNTMQQTKYVKTIGESSKQVYGDTSYAKQDVPANPFDEPEPETSTNPFDEADKHPNNPFNEPDDVYVIENETTTNQTGDQVIYEYGKTKIEEVPTKVGSNKSGDRAKFIAETANNLASADSTKKPVDKKLKIVDNTARSRLMATFSGVASTSQRNGSITEPQPIYSENQLEFNSRQNRPRNQKCCSKFCEEFTVFKKPSFYPSLVLYLYQRLMPLFFWILLPSILLRAGLPIVLCITFYLAASIIGMSGNVLISKLSKMSANMRLVYLSVFCMLASMALYEVTKVYNTMTILVITLIASFCISCSTSLSRAAINDYLEIQDLNKSRTILTTIYALCLVFATFGHNNYIDSYYRVASFVNISIGMLYGSFVMFRIWFKFNKHPSSQLTISRT